MRLRIIISMWCCAVLWLLAAAPPALAALNNVPDRTFQTDGTVYCFLRVGNTIYMGGRFGRVGGVRRSNLAAFDASTGLLKPWSPTTNGPVYALAASPDGRRIYVGGDFSRTDGTYRDDLAALDASTGRTLGGWRASADAPVRAIEVYGTRIYVGGDFRKVDGKTRYSIALLGAADGALVENWKAGVRGSVRRIDVVGSRLYVGGAFSTIRGPYRRNLEALHPLSGRVAAWSPNPRRPVIDFAVTRKRVYAAQGGLRGGAASAYSTGSGRIVWSQHTNGNTQAVAVMSGLVYFGGHFDRVGGRHRGGFFAIVPRSGSLSRGWAPDANKLGPYELLADTSRGRLYAGGDFTSINNRQRIGFARFSMR
ncbi:PQQ-binding-like beta-propeller repeat protein [Rubrobacter calidifluminis]|uniref:outer membrane protein assembly factor BamB family protein n=1 Tax=Rubrobacter calidifluminis TaxID=1392640 RepID=UPI002360A249|nr:PQQ-binding-like beta-propeller repeat protein [Rubrobacter calidifluminis]